MVLNYNNINPYCEIQLPEIQHKIKLKYFCVILYVFFY